MTNKNGGPAFPIKEPTNFDALGMTLRDYFAAKALARMLSDLPKSLYGMDWEENVVKAAFQIADAMLKEKNRG